MPSFGSRTPPHVTFGRHASARHPACSEWWSRTAKWYFVVIVMSVLWGQRPLQATQGSVVRHLSERLSLTSLVWVSAVPSVKHSVVVPAGMVGIPPPLLTVITVLWYLQSAWNTCRPSQTRRREGRSSFRRRFRSRRVKPGSVKISKDFQDLLSKECYFVEKNVKEVG